MADEEQLAVLCQGKNAWNAWREQNPNIRVNLSGAELSGADLSGADLSKADLSRADFFGATLSGANLNEAYLSRANLSGACFSGAYLFRADLSGADLSRAELTGAYLSGATLPGACLSKAHLFMAHLPEAYLFSADLSGADLSKADLCKADLSKADLSRAKLSGADLTKAHLVGTNFTSADLTGSRVYGISAWGLKLEGAEQQNLVITDWDEPEITVDNLEVAQFIYLLLNNERIRHVIDTITSKVVLILGRFTEERKVVLDALREELRRRDYTPVLFDFDKPASKDLTGTVQTLANMARFIIADLTDPSSVPHELAMVVPTTPVPVQPVLLEGQREYAMFADLRRRHHWVLEPYCYASPERLIADLSEQVIVPAEARARELRGALPPTA
jgi:uncharacterized protein YjbI with pentapeptide repeats